MKRFTTIGISALTLIVMATTSLWTATPTTTDAHCQVPCGIYDDPARIKHLMEDAATIETAITSIQQLAGGHQALAFNQAARWVATKEDHASHIITVVSEYFLTQKVKPVAAGSGDYDAYLKKLADHHAVMVAAMKCKQNADPSTVQTLKAAIQALGKHYGG